MMLYREKGHNKFKLKPLRNRNQNKCKNNNNQTADIECNILIGQNRASVFTITLFVYTINLVPKRFNMSQ